jgi:hypothetical protein
VWKHRRLRLVSAAILSERRSVARHQTFRLREAPGRPAPEARVIDADYSEVGKKRRFLRRVLNGVLTVLAAAAVGFLIPPAFVVVQEISAYFAGR